MSHVYIVSQYENSATNRGVRYPRLLETLRSKGKATLLSGNFDHGRKQPIADSDIGADELMFSVPSYTSHYGLRRFLAHWVFAWRSAWFLLRSIKSGDKIVVSSIPPEPCLAATLVARLRGASVLIDVRDIWPDALPLTGVRRWLFGFYSHSFNFLSLRLASIVVVVSQSFTDWVRRYHRRIPVQFIPLGFDPSRWESARHDRRVSQGKFEFVYIGGLTSQFDLSEFSFLKDGLGLAIVGSGPLEAGYRKRFPKATFFGLLPKDEASAVVLSARKGLVPGARFAALPNKVFDFLAAGLSVVCHPESEAYEFLEPFGLAVSSLDETVVGEPVGPARETVRAEISNYEHQFLADQMAELLDLE